MAEQLGEVIKSHYVEVCATVFANTVLHPLEYAKVLIQLGHEPLPLERGKYWIFFGQELYCLPNIFKYIGYIKKTKGFIGLYRGLGSSLCRTTLDLGVTMILQQHLDEVYPDAVLNAQQLQAETDGECYCRFFKKTLKETAVKTSAIIICRPFQVVMIRSMAQFIGGENICVGVFQSFSTIYADEGVAGLFSGLCSQIVGDLAIFWTYKSVLFVVDRIWIRYFQEDDYETKGFKPIIQCVIPYVVSSILYPFSLVSTLMAVNGSPLKVGQVPYTPIFMHWQDCWDYLRAGKQLKRGSKLFFRWYDGPITYSNGMTYAQPYSEI